MRAGDRVIGISLGILLGVAIVVLFVFLGSRQTVDDPSISDGGGGQTPTQQAPAPAPQQP